MGISGEQIDKGNLVSAGTVNRQLYTNDSGRSNVRYATNGALAAYTGTGTNTLTAAANGALVVDGATPSANDRILQKDGAAGADNGVYVVTQVGSAGLPYILDRAPDLSTSEQYNASAYFMCQDGAVNDGKLFYLDTSGTITLNTTALTFKEMGSAVTDRYLVFLASAFTGGTPSTIALGFTPTTSAKHTAGFVCSRNGLRLEADFGGSPTTENEWRINGSNLEVGTNITASGDTYEIKFKSTD